MDNWRRNFEILNHVALGGGLAVKLRVVVDECEILPLKWRVAPFLIARFIFHLFLSKK